MLATLIAAGVFPVKTPGLDNELAALVYVAFLLLIVILVWVFFIRGK